MRYMVEENFILVVGTIWMPATTASTRYELSRYDLDNIGEFTRENVERWLSTHSGDFQHVQDFYATAGDVEIPWATEEGEIAYADTVWQPEDAA
jgi:hypothetical protein